MWSPGPVSNERGSTVTVSSTIADGVGGRVSQEVAGYDATTNQGSVYPGTGLPSGGVVIGGGTSISVQQEFNYPVLKGNPTLQAAQSKLVDNVRNQVSSTVEKLIPSSQPQSCVDNRNLNNKP